MTEPEPVDDAVAVDVVARRPRRRRTGAIAVAVVALVAVGSGATWLATRGGGAGAADGGVCPTSMPTTTFDPDDDHGWSLGDLVPAAPTVPGLDGRLVPVAGPTGIVLCEYHAPFEGSLPGGGAPAGGGPSDAPSDSATLHSEPDRSTRPLSPNSRSVVPPLTTSATPRSRRCWLRCAMQRSRLTASTRAVVSETPAWLRSTCCG